MPHLSVKVSDPRFITLMSVLALLVLVAWLHWYFLPETSESRLLTVGGIAELVLWGLLATLLVGTQIWTLPVRIRQMLTVGLVLWLVAATADVMDEFRYQPMWMSAYMEDVTRVLGMLVVTLGLLSLIRHVGRTMQELETLSMIDPLTGLSNRRMFRHSVEARLERGFSLILMDLDHFKHVNDRYGHDVGDEVLCKVAAALKQLRSNQCEVFRLGGEEFAIVTEALPDEQLVELGDTIRTRITELDAAPELSLTLSAGLGTLRNGEQYSQLMRRVDQALYRVKDGGRNQVMLADAEPVVA